MNKKMGRLLRPNLGLYGLCVVVFAIATFFTEQYILAAAELFVAAALVVVYTIYRVNRKKTLKAYISKLTEENGDSTGKKNPFPMAVIRMEDGFVVYGNTAFINLTGFRDRFYEKNFHEVIPGFEINWLSEGKTEYPHEITINKRRYRV